MVKVRLKYIVFTVSTVFFFGFTAFLFHHHHLPLQLVSCGICEAKTSTSGAQSKPNTDWGFTALSESSQMTLYLICYGLVAFLPFPPLILFAFSLFRIEPHPRAFFTRITNCLKPREQPFQGGFFSAK